MAQAINLPESQQAEMNMHHQMQDCEYCPNHQSELAVQILCEALHADGSDYLPISVDHLHVDACILYEIPCPISLPGIALTEPLQSSPDVSYRIHQLNPLEITGILRI
jgi:hypothetical protein